MMLTTVMHELVHSALRTFGGRFNQHRARSLSLQSNFGGCCKDEQSSRINMPTADELRTVTVPAAKVAKYESDDYLGSKIVLKFAKLTEDARTPSKGSKLAAGYDLYSAYDYVIPAKGKILAMTDIQIALPSGCYGRVAGVIDQDYRGNVGVVMFNFSDSEFEVKKHDRIAQLVLERIFLAELQECTSLDETDRGSGGFGSTGKN